MKRKDAKKEKKNQATKDQVIILKDQLIIYDSIIKKLKYLTDKVYAFGYGGSYDVAKAYIDFYEDCMKKIKILLEEGKEIVNYSELDCSPEYDFFEENPHTAGKDVKSLLKTFKNHLNRYNAGQKKAPLLFKNSNKKYVDYKDCIIPNPDGLKLVYRDCPDKENELCLDIENRKELLKEYRENSILQLQELVEITSREYEYIKYFISAFYTAVAYPIIVNIHLVKGNGKFNLFGLIVFLIFLIFTILASYKIGGSFKHLEKDRFMFLRGLARQYLLLPFKPILLLMKIKPIKKSLEELSNKYSFFRRICKILEFIRAIQNHKDAIIKEEIQEINGKRVANKVVYTAKEMLCPKCLRSGIKSNLIGVSGKNGSYAVCELYSESHMFKIDSATLELEEIPYMDKKL